MTAANVADGRLLPLIAMAALGATAASETRAAVPSPQCSGPSSFLSIVDRPTAGDSGCVLPQGRSDIEAGVTGGTLYGAPGGSFYALPNLTYRWGLPQASEIAWSAPDFQVQSSQGAGGIPAATSRGYGPTMVGLKHILGYNERWQWTVEALTVLPSGDSAFGSRGLGGAVNTIISYGDGALGVSLMLGGTSQTEPTSAGGHRFQSFNPDFVTTWAVTTRLQVFGEVYAQSHTGHLQSWGTDTDAGVQYMSGPNLVLDLEEGLRVQGSPGGISSYTGAGVALMF